ncbi:RNA polymerase II associated protein [Schizosaccharomyces japonicus yFS275]|uniref:RNA polymerase II associated protein n=1 Tax=Schizosaccharomyces japonicus (strain yFS275 / FY16936) TaxID=402676 RepID=B6K754_SCHJY|nr:RNA polymerase II associated protein [Schizosaccharomyces japonicus yFS275]EEB09358.1 RNA polymerase II associated protein [Schizosaccharomyces japonicus yFS275]
MQKSSPVTGKLFGSILGDIVEKQPIEKPAPPSVSTANAKGFPSIPNVLPQRRKKVSAFKQRQNRQRDSQPAKQSETQGIDEENEARLSQMSRTEIEDALQELQSSLSPEALEVLKLRSKQKYGQMNEEQLNHEEQKTTKEQRNVYSSMEPVVQRVLDSASQAGQDPDGLLEANETVRQELPVGEKKTVRFAEEPEVTPVPEQSSVSGNAEQSKTATALNAAKFADEVHIPQKRVDLNPEDKNFYEALHEKYFPNLPVDEKHMQWLRDPLPVEDTYNPDMEFLTAKELRFGFKGQLITPSQSQQIPVNEGLHHHGDAPMSAGYTIVELAHLMRSRVPAQRCIAIQTIGRALYRLNKDEFGPELGPELHTLVEDAQIIPLLMASASDQERHLSVRSLAIEALWLWKESQQKRTREAY